MIHLDFAAMEMPALHCTSIHSVPLVSKGLQNLIRSAMELSRAVPRSLARQAARSLTAHDSLAPVVCSPMAVWSRRQFTTRPSSSFPGPQSMGMGGSGGSSPSYFQRSQSLPANTIIRFVPQQTAWIVERMGKFNRILSPGLAILIPVIDVRSYDDGRVHVLTS